MPLARSSSIRPWGGPRIPAARDLRYSFPARFAPTTREEERYVPISGLAGTDRRGRRRGRKRTDIDGWDYVELPGPVLASAQAESSYLFGVAGVRVEWLECNPHLRRGPGCEVPGPSDIILRILPRSDRQAQSGADILGRAIGERYADVYDAEVSRAVLDQNVSRRQAYAMAMTHELGHLLLGPGAHTPKGIMRPQWVPVDFDR